jgi:WD40 repeat protein
VENEAYSDARWAEAFTAVSEDRRLLALSFKDETIQVLDLRTWGHGVKFEGPYCDLYGVALSPDSQLAAIALEDNSIHIWDRKMSQKLLVLNDATDHVYSITFSHDSRYLAAKSKDGYVRVWSCSTWERTSLLAEESVGQEYVEIAFNPRCLSLATYANKNTALQIWDINPVAVKGELEMSRILFLAAEPVDIPTPLRVDVESREITEKLKLGEYGNSFDVVFEMATRPEDLTRALINKRPHYVHFSGHGTKNGALCLLNKNNETHLVRPESLARIFKPFSKQVICVILSACFSEPQALAIAEHVDYVIGMNKEIGDKSAIAFAVGFYQAIGGNLTVEDAFDLGCGQIDVQNLPDHLVPVLIRKRA